MQTHDRIPIRFYPEFWDRDWPDFPEPVRRALCVFLEELQTDPDNAELLAKCESDQKGRLGFGFLEGHAVYWRVEREQPGQVTELHSLKVIRIRVLNVGRIET